MSNALQALSIQRESDCYIARRALEMWLSFLTPVRWLTVIGSTVLSAVAGAAILSTPRLLGGSFKTTAGLCACGAALLSSLHTALHCDTYQAECRRLISSYTALEAAFQALRALPQSQLSTKEQELERKYEDIVNAAMASPPARYRRHAMKEWVSVRGARMVGRIGE
jgi:hypothetical protein